MCVRKCVSKCVSKLSVRSSARDDARHRPDPLLVAMTTIVFVTDAASDVSEIQNEVDRTLLPFTVDCRARTSFGST